MTPSIELAVLMIVSLSCIEACSYNSDCLNGYADTSDFQCCYGQCIDKQSACRSILPLVSTAFLSVGVVIICIIACCCCYPFCPCFKQYHPRTTRAFIMEGEPLYQHFTWDPTAIDMAEPSCRDFYPQFVSLQHGHPIQQQSIPNHPYPLMQPDDQAWCAPTDVGLDDDAAPPYTKIAH